MKRLKESILDTDFADKVKLTEIYDIIKKGNVVMELKSDNHYLFTKGIFESRSAVKKQLKETLRYAIGPVNRDGDGVELIENDIDNFKKEFIKWIKPYLNTTGKYIFDNFESYIIMRPITVWGKKSDPGKMRIGNNAGLSFRLEFADGPTYNWKNYGGIQSPLIIGVGVITWK